MSKFNRALAVAAIDAKKVFVPGIAVLAAFTVLVMLAYFGCSSSPSSPKFQEYTAMVIGGGSCANSISDYRLMIALARSGDVEAFRSLMNEGLILPLAELTGVRVLSTDEEGRAGVLVISGEYIQRSCWMPANLLTDVDKAKAEAEKAQAAQAATAVAAAKLGVHEALVGTHSVVGCAITLRDEHLLSEAIGSGDTKTENALVSHGQVLALKGGLTRVRDLSTNADGLSKVTVLNGPHTGKTCWMPTTTLLTDVKKSKANADKGPR
jgi:hypothetical protein